jgi:protein-disulfide isomerase
MTAAWFLLGVLFGVVGITVFNGLMAKPGLDAATVQQASRNGVLEALATVQANSAPAVDVAPTPAAMAAVPVVSQTAFSLREANRQGDSRAPITIVEFSDFQCPFCRRAFDQILPQVIKDYVAAGKASIVYKHSAFLGQESIWAAQASECAADQGKFWDFHNLLFTRQNGENQGAFTQAKLIGFASELKLDMARFEPCLTGGETLARVQADAQEGRTAGVTGTPMFFINGQLFAGARPYDQFRAVIEGLLVSPQ